MIKKLNLFRFVGISLTGGLIFCTLLFVFHIMLNAFSKNYQTYFHASRVSISNVLSKGFEQDSLYIALRNKSNYDDSLYLYYEKAYIATRGFLRSLYIGPYETNSILRGITYEIINDTLCFVFTDRFITNNSIYKFYMKNGFIIKLSISNPYGYEILVAINDLSKEKQSEYPDKKSPVQQLLKQTK